MEVRLDKYLWAVRIFKTRSDAADAVRNNRVLVNDAYAKPSREVKVGDIIAVKKTLVTYTYRVKELVINRQPAVKVIEYCENITPADELALQESEVADAKWVTEDELKEMITSGKFHNYGDEYFDRMFTQTKKYKGALV